MRIKPQTVIPEHLVVRVAPATEAGMRAKERRQRVTPPDWLASIVRDLPPDHRPAQVAGVRQRLEAALGGQVPGRFDNKIRGLAELVEEGEGD